MRHSDIFFISIFLLPFINMHFSAGQVFPLISWAIKKPKPKNLTNFSIKKWFIGSEEIGFFWFKFALAAIFRSFLSEFKQILENKIVSSPKIIREVQLSVSFLWEGRKRHRKPPKRDGNAKINLKNCPRSSVFRVFSLEALRMAQKAIKKRWKRLNLLQKTLKWGGKAKIHHKNCWKKKKICYWRRLGEWESQKLPEKALKKAEIGF